MNIYFGDIHNHCGVSYGQGPIEDAVKNAKLQLDFVSVTGHALWPDMPREQHGMERRIKYHEDGFRKLEGCWEHFSKVLDDANSDGEFVTFLGYEMHSCASGDHTIIYRDGKGEILQTKNIDELRSALDKLNADGIKCVAIPHHIGYKQGFRGINWKTFKNTVSPLIEFFSMHGCAESDYTAYPYLHSMGPCDHDSTFSAGLKHGHIIGAMASTDHHSAHPGSHGHGRLSVHAESLSRKDIWEAIENRRTVALTGDNIYVNFFLNDAFMGEIIETPSHCRNIQFDIEAGGAIRSVELLKNEEVLKHIFVPEVKRIPSGQKTVRAKISLEVGWGSRGKTVYWDAFLGINEGRILKVEPRFKGAEIVSPVEKETEYNFSSWEANGEKEVYFKTKTQGNPTPVTNSNQGFSIEVEMPVNSEVKLNLNGHSFCHKINELVAGPVSNYIDGYGTPAYRICAALPEEYEFKMEFEDNNNSEPLASGYDVYRLRVEQYNKQWAWSSPIWIARWLKA